ncbi:MAG: flagella basal body P-ring formation protein FlgA [Erythrobacter sp.]
MLSLSTKLPPSLSKGISAKLRRQLGLNLGRALTPLCFAPMAAIMFTPLYAPVFASPNSAQTAIIDPAEIDLAVQAFTGAGIGETGGARAPSDRRLRLASCAQPLSTAWHGVRQSAVRVECRSTISGAGPWKIFVATRPAAGPANGSAARASNTGGERMAAGPVIKRGDPITVLVRGRGFSVQQSGEAMENGAIGEWIGIRTARNAKPVRARIERPGLAVIPAS